MQGKVRLVYPLSGHAPWGNFCMGQKLSAAGLGEQDDARRKASRATVNKKDLKKEQERKSKERKEKLKALEEARSAAAKRTSKSAAELAALQKKGDPREAWPAPK